MCFCNCPYEKFHHRTQDCSCTYGGGCYYDDLDERERLRQKDNEKEADDGEDD